MTPPRPPDADLRCLKCGYNLRGLSGDPIRCPECFHLNALQVLYDAHWPPAPTARLDDILLGLTMMPVLIATWLALSYCGLPILVVSLLFLVYYLRALRTMLGGRADWARLVASYVLKTWLRPLAVVGPCLLAIPAVALVFQLAGDEFRIDFISVVVGTLGGALVSWFFVPFAALTKWQHQAYVRLARITIESVPVEVRLQRGEDANSFTPDMKRQSITSLLAERFAAAISAVTGLPAAEIDPVVRPSGDPKFGDYQCNAAMALAKRVGAKPRELAEKIVAVVDLAGVAEKLEIAGAGFINIRLDAAWLGGYLGQIARAETEDRLGLPPAANPQRVIVDYSSPNIAKQMHVGHLRSTIIGDALARVLAFRGHEVIRQNHVGDWGTQFGMLIEHYTSNPLPIAADHEEVLAKFEDDYRAANERFKSDPAFADAARLAVGKLQSGDTTARDVWRRVCAASSAAFTDLYQRLRVQLRDEDIRGESFYNDRLAPTIAALRQALPPLSPPPADRPYAECRDDRGAVCVFLHKPGGEPLFKNPEGDILPLIVQKSDGAFLYATTDLAAIRYRVGELGASRVLYVVGAPTKLHLEMVFAAARLAKFAGPDVALEHVSFGQVLGEDRKLLRTRTGGAVKLKDLLDEAERRAYEIVAAKHAELGEDAEPIDEAELRRIARAVGIGAVKWFDLARDRNADYVFNYDTMLAMQGSTAPYMMYAYTRVRSIYRKASATLANVDPYDASVRLMPIEPAERALALHLARFGDAVDAVARELTPHVLCAYLYDLAGEFMRFYEACPVIKAADDDIRASRLRLCDLTARTLRVGLGLIGIDVLERM